ncbi:DNA polymerase iota isoform X3 [Rattus norvegicus]|uniref:DNA polymerase iota isoform X3 n=1 Tax=Rattus norvegicus TaxID=10116 RepID=UPI0003D0DBE4|nr:DNA polymerase iota isoform X2 [Rattus norvegicus]|eukprot:XP_006254962.1 PREDICTED: DNA polymerase iota isoform X1 [Rattus norvegicus]
MGVEPEEEGGPAEEEDFSRAMEPSDSGAAGGSRAVCDQGAPSRIASSRVIVHVDLDCFYAQVEMISNPELKDKPLGVQQKYLVVTCNYEARKLGVKKLMNVRDAKEKCPQLVLVNGEDLSRYREMSYKVTEMVEKRLQQLPSDEVPSVTMSGHVYNNQSVNLHSSTHVRLAVGSQIAAEMREAMHNQLGLTGCAGVAPNKLLAKLVSGVFKPNQQTVLLPESCQHLIHSLNHIKEMPGIGYKTAKRLEVLGINSVHDLQTFPIKTLEKELGISVAQRIRKLSFGEDKSPVTPSGPPQSFSEEDTFKKCSSEVEAKTKIEELLSSLLNRVCHDGRKPHTIRLVIRRYSDKHCNRESRQCPIPSHVIQKLGTGNYDAVPPLMEILMKLFRNMVNVKMAFHLTLLSVCFCNLKALNSAKKGPMDCFLTSSLSTTACSGKRSFKVKDIHMEDSYKEKEANWDCLPSRRIESTRRGESPSDATCFPKEKDTSDLPLQFLPEGVDQEVFTQLPADIQEEILSGKSRENLQGKGSLSCPLHASRGVLSFFSTKQTQAGCLSPRDTLLTGKQASAVSPCEPGTSGLSTSSSSHPSCGKDCSYYVDNQLKDERMSQGPTESQGFHFSNTNPAVSVFHSFPNLQSEQLFSTHRTADSHKQTATTSHQGLENREQDSADEKLTFPSDIDPQVFYELPEEVQRELMAEWKRAGAEFPSVHK